VRGKPKEIEELANKLKSTKGVKHGSLTMSTIGKEI
jgi:CopG family nickel-responsive transcriptional regulator